MSTLESASGGILNPAEWTIDFQPFPNKATVGSCTVSRNGFTYAGSLNHDIAETVDAFWAEARKAEAEHIAGLPEIKAAQDEIRRAA